MAMAEQPTPDEVLWGETYQQALNHLLGPQVLGGVDIVHYTQLQEQAMQAADNAVARRQRACRGYIEGSEQ